MLLENITYRHTYRAGRIDSGQLHWGYELLAQHLRGVNDDQSFRLKIGKYPDNERYGRFNRALVVAVSTAPGRLAIHLVDPEKEGMSAEEHSRFFRELPLPGSFQPTELVSVGRRYLGQLQQSLPADAFDSLLGLAKGR